MKRALLLSGVLALGSLSVAAAAQAAGTDVTTVYAEQAFAGSTGTLTVPCPVGQHALDGGAAPVAQVPGASQFVLNQSAPVGSTLVPGTVSNGMATAGWSATFSSRNGSQLGSWRVYATCSTAAAATWTVAGTGGTVAASIGCPSGLAVGGGLTLTTGSSAGQPQLKLSGPSHSTLPSSFGTDADGAVPLAWQVALTGSSSDVLAVAVCAQVSDATLVGAVLTVPTGDGTQAGTAAPACPAGQLAVGAGLASNNASDSMRIGYELPDLATLSSWTMQGAGGTNSNIYKAYAVCVSGAYTPPVAYTPPPVDTTPPQTMRGKAPKKTTTATTAKVTFGSEPGATFTCGLDKAKAKPCTSPYKAKKLKPGKHKLTVTAIDAAGNADPTPAVFKWKVVKKKPKR